jgi:glycosyltransferase involved in cell wall biosynthesis
VVSFRGNVEHAAVLDMLTPERVAGVVLPSYHEGIPVSLMEAMARRVPVIATDVGGVRELVSPSTGFLAPPGDAGALGGAMVALFGTPAEELQRLTARAFEALSKEHDATVTAARLERLLSGHT